MIWVYVFGGIALAGLIMLIGYAIWLTHKASDVFAEVKVVGQRGEKLFDILAQIQIPDPSDAPSRDIAARHAGGQQPHLNNLRTKERSTRRKR